MTAERCMCGATDCPRCFPDSWDTPEPTHRQLELALEEVIECVMDHGQYPANGYVQFDLYDFLYEHRDPSFVFEMYVASMSSNTQAFENRIERERKKVEEMLVDYLSDSDIVADRASEIAAEEE